MDILRSSNFSLHNSDDVMRLRQAARAWMVEMKFSLIDQTKMVTATSELARNTVKHGGGGTACVEALDNGVRTGLRLVFEDHGPGIADIPLAMTDGYGTGNGLGLGLGGSKRLVDDFDIRSVPGEGTQVTIVRWK